MVTEEEFKGFYAIDRSLYSILVMNLWRDPVESMQIIGLFIWLELMNFDMNVVMKILTLPHSLISQVADEAMLCLNCINNDAFVYENLEIPLIQSLVDKEISLEYFHLHSSTAAEGVAAMIRDICKRAFSDIMQQAIFERNKHQQILHEDDAHCPEDRTMFVTFSKGCPVKESEVKEFFTKSFGECIESIHMQQVNNSRKQALFAKVVFNSVATIQMVLHEKDIEKFDINGKHVWARKFVPRLPNLASTDSALPSCSNLQSPI